MTDHLHALAMRTKAVAAIDAAGDNDELGGSYNTFEAYGAGLWVAMEVVAALPLEADHAEILAEAVKLPEIAALIETAKNAAKRMAVAKTAVDECQQLAMEMWIRQINRALEPFAALETP